jgi:hypothetical protein
MTDSNELRELQNGFERFRLVTGYGKFCAHSDQFYPKLWHVTVYAKDPLVRNFILGVSNAPNGRVVTDQYCDIEDIPLFSNQ